MRKLFSVLTGRSSSGAADGGRSSSGGGGGSLTGGVSNVSSSGSPSPTERAVENDESASKIIIAAATALSKAIHEILLDSPRLSGEDLSGFYHLIDLLNDEACATSKAVEENLDNAVETNNVDDVINRLASSWGRGCLRILLRLKARPCFITACGSAGLAIELVNAMRLLRMLEIKNTKLLSRCIPSSSSSSSPSSSSFTEESRGKTFQASLAASKLLAHLCTRASTVEYLKPNLEKLLCYPISTLPVTGVHLQSHCATVVTSLCEGGLTADLVWFLHEVKVVKKMFNFLSELCGSDKVETGNIASGGTEMLLQRYWSLPVKDITNLHHQSYPSPSYI